MTVLAIKGQGVPPKRCGKATEIRYFIILKEMLTQEPLIVQQVLKLNLWYLIQTKQAGTQS